MTNRISADQLFLSTAVLLSERGTCLRAQVGCVITIDRRIVSTGYVGSPPGEAHCLDVGCLTTFNPSEPSGTEGCQRTIHAEANAIAYGARTGARLDGATLYTTLAPCRACSQLLLAAGIRRVVHALDYRDMTGVQLLRRAGITVEQQYPRGWEASAS